MTGGPCGTRRLVAAAWWLVLAAVCIAPGAVSAQRAESPRSQRHRHRDLERPIIQDSVPELVLVDTTLGRATRREHVVTDRRGRYSAFTVGLTRLYVLDRRTRRILEVRGLPFDGRPFSDVTWADGGVLLFDRWSSPHYAMHYGLDIARRRIVASQSFHDRGQ